jgi:hypothetical protein
MARELIEKLKEIGVVFSGDIPTLQELVDACGDSFIGIRGCNSCDENIWQANGKTSDSAFIGTFGETREDAVARLLIATHNGSTI